jgi:hypothetical protein
MVVSAGTSWSVRLLRATCFLLTDYFHAWVASTAATSIPSATITVCYFGRLADRGLALAQTAALRLPASSLARMTDLAFPVSLSVLTSPSRKGFPYVEAFEASPSIFARLSQPDKCPAPVVLPSDGPTSGGS